MTDLLRVLVGVDAEIAEVAALPAEGDVQVKAKGPAGVAGRVEGVPGLTDGRRAPNGKRRIVRDEIAADAGVIVCGHARGFSHR